MQLYAPAFNQIIKINYVHENFRLSLSVDENVVDSVSDLIVH